MDTEHLSLVVGYMDDPEGTNALRFSIALANRLNADLHLVHVIDLRDFPLDPDQVDWEEGSVEILHHTKGHVRSELIGFAGEWTYQAVRGDPVKALRDHATLHDAFMVIVGTHGDHPGAGLMRLFGGSVSRGLVRHLNRPILVVPLNTQDTTAGVRV